MHIFAMMHERHEADVFPTFLVFLVPRLGCFKNVTPSSVTMSVVLDI